MTDESATMGVMLGELKGKVGELVHSVGNVAMKVEAIAKEVAALSREMAVNSSLPKEVENLKARVTALEASENRRAGAITFGAILMRTVPWASLGAGAAAVLKMTGAL